MAKKTTSPNPEPKEQESSIPKPIPAPSLVPKKLEISSLTLDQKLSLLNAFRKIRAKPPKIKDPEAKGLIAELYLKWIDDTMLHILHPENKALLGLSMEEIQALKVLAQTILQRQQNPQNPIPPIQMMGANPAPQNAAPLLPKGRLDPGLNSDSYRQAQSQFLSELAKMERQGPEF